MPFMPVPHISFLLIAGEVFVVVEILRLWCEGELEESLLEAELVEARVNAVFPGVLNVSSFLIVKSSGSRNSVTIAVSFCAASS